MAESLIGRGGSLEIGGSGDWTALEMAGVLRAIDTSYRVCSHIELEAHDLVLRQRRHGPRRPLLLPRFTIPDEVGVAQPLIVGRVRFESPGLLEFLGALNPLEVLRKYINDRHERQKDRSYRDEAERRALELQNAILELRYVREAAELEREFQSNRVPADQIQQLWLSRIQKPLDEVAGYVDRGLIDAGSATTRRDKSRDESDSYRDS